MIERRQVLQFYLSYTGQGKCKFRSRTGHEGPEGEQNYSCTLSLTSALDGVGGQRHAPAALPPGKIRYVLYRRLGGPQGRSRRVLKISPITGIQSPDRPASSESLYRRSYRALSLSYTEWNTVRPTSFQGRRRDRNKEF